MKATLALNGLKQAVACLQVGTCSNKRTPDLNWRAPALLLKIQKKQFYTNQPQQSFILVLVILVFKIPVKHLLKIILKEDHWTLLLPDEHWKNFPKDQTTMAAKNSFLVRSLNIVLWFFFTSRKETSTASGG